MGRVEKKIVGAVVLLLCLLYCTGATTSAPTQAQVDEWDQAVIANNAKGVEYVPFLSPPRFVVPSAGLSSKIKSLIMPSNNCVGIKLYNNTLFMGWRYIIFYYYLLLH